MPTDSWSKRRIFCGIKSRAKEERKKRANGGSAHRTTVTDIKCRANERKKTAEPCPN